MASTNFTNLTRTLVQGNLNFGSNTFKVLLVSAAPTEAQLDGWANRSDITNEITGTGYTAGGLTQGFTLDAIDTANNRQSITWSNIINGWTGATFSAFGAIIYKNSGNSSTDTLLHYIDFSALVACTNGTFSISYSTPLYINR